GRGGGRQDQRQRHGGDPARGQRRAPRSHPFSPPGARPPRETGSPPTTQPPGPPPSGRPPPQPRPDPPPRGAPPRAMPLPPLAPAPARPGPELEHPSPLIGRRDGPARPFRFGSAQGSTIQRWDLKEGKKTAFAGHKSWVRGLACHPKEKVLYSGGYEGRVIAWPLDAEKPEPLFTIDAHKGWLRAVAVSPDGNLRASCGNDGAVRVWA